MKLGLIIWSGPKDRTDPPPEGDSLLAVSLRRSQTKNISKCDWGGDTQKVTFYQFSCFFTKFAVFLAHFSPQKNQLSYACRFKCVLKHQNTSKVQMFCTNNVSYSHKMPKSKFEKMQFSQNFAHDFPHKNASTILKWRFFMIFSHIRPHISQMACANAGLVPPNSLLTLEVTFTNFIASKTD